MAKLFANSRDPDQTLRSAAFYLGLYCLPSTLLQVSRLQWVKSAFLRCFQQHPQHFFVKSEKYLLDAPLLFWRSDLHHVCMPVSPNNENKYSIFSTLVLLNLDMAAFSNSVDPDQMASSEANWSGSALFAIKCVNLYQQPGSSNLIGLKIETVVAS